MYISKSRNIIQACARFCTVVIFGILFTNLVSPSASIMNRLPVIIVVLSVSEIVMLIYNRNVRNTGLTMIFFLYTLLCHNGFIVAYYFDSSYINFKSITSMAYVSNPFYPKAIIISNIVMIVFVWMSEINTNGDTYFEEGLDSEYAPVVGSQTADIIGIISVGFGTLLLAYIIFSHGLFLKMYTDVLAVTRDIPMMQHGVIITSLGIALLISSGSAKGIKIGLIIYLVDMLLHFSIGNRGEVLYSAVVCFALYSLRFHTIKKKHILIAGIAVILFIPVVRIMREGKLDVYTFNPIGSFLDVLCEEGFQISPFTYIVEYVESGNNHVWGMTYINDFADFLLRRVGSSSPWMGIEKYVIKSIMPYKGMGFSMVAELYYNFTTVGACIVYGLFSRFFIRLDQKIFAEQISPMKKIFFSMLMVEMINLTRNDASTLPVYMMYSLIFVLIYYILNSVIKN